MVCIDILNKIDETTSKNKMDKKFTKERFILRKQNIGNFLLLGRNDILPNIANTKELCISSDNVIAYAVPFKLSNELFEGKIEIIDKDNVEITLKKTKKGEEPAIIKAKISFAKFNLIQELVKVHHKIIIENITYYIPGKKR